MAIQVNRSGAPDPLPARMVTRNTPAAASNGGPGLGEDTFVSSAPPAQSLSAADGQWLAQKRMEMLQGRILEPRDAARYYRLSRLPVNGVIGTPPSPPSPGEVEPPASDTGPPAPVGSASPPDIPGLTREEVAWVQALSQNVQGGYQPTAAELQQYQALSQKVAAAQAASQPPGATTPPVADQTPAPSTPPPPGVPAATPAIPELTPEEISWIQNLAQKVQGGYQPTEAELTQYQALSQKAAAARPGSTPGPGPVAVGADDAQWAADLEARVQNGYSPTPADIARYQRIKGLAPTSEAPATTSPAANPPAVVPAGPASPQELQWATQLEAKVQQGYTPTLTEVQTYQEIRNRAGNPVAQPPTAPAPAVIPSAPAFKTYTPFLQNENPAAPATPPPTPAKTPAIPLTQEELAWAQGLEQQIQLGYQPSPQELQAYEAMKVRYAATAGGGMDPNDMPLYTEQELQWAQTIEQAVAQGYQPVPEEAQAYQEVKRRFLLDQQRKAAKPTDAVVSQLEVQWAAQLKKRIEGGYQPNPQEAQALKDIARRLLALQQAAGGGNTPATTTAQAPPSQLEQQYSQVNWQEWSKPIGSPPSPAFTIAPVTPGPNLAIVTQLPTLSVPPTLQPINADGKPLPIQAPTQQEMQWATQLEQKVQQGYQPTAQEIQQHDEVFRRYQASRTNAGGGFFSRLKQGWQNLSQRLFKRQTGPVPQP